MNAEEQQSAIEPVAIEAEEGRDAPVAQSLPAEASVDPLTVDGEASDVQASADSSVEQDAVLPDQVVVAEDAAADDAADAVAEAVADGLAEGVMDAEAEAGEVDAGAESESESESDTLTPEVESSDAAAVTDLAPLDESALVPVPPPVPQPVHVIALNEKYPAAAGHRAFWREAGYECRAVIQNANVTVSCKRMDDIQEAATQEPQPVPESQAVQESQQTPASQPPQPPQAPRSQAQEILLRRRFVSQGEAVAFMEACLAFDPNNAAELGFDEVGRII